MTIQDKIDSLKREIKQWEYKQSNCVHIWLSPKYDPEIKYEEYALPGQYDTQGIHMWPRTSTREVQVPRWSRTCSLCGATEYTFAQKETKTFTPSF